MAQSLVFYRKWRPQRLAEVVGQEAVVQTLRNALATGRVAHAYLFTGPRGTGKTSLGRILAKAVNCLTTGGRDDPCNECESCRAITEGRALDMIEIDAASNRGIDEIRELRERAQYAPAVARRKVYILDEAHGLTGDAANAFLKILEEPPPHVLFILATTEPHRLLATVASRCQRFEFHRLGGQAMLERLAYIADQEGLKVSEGALRLLSRSAAGSLRDAENLLEQVLTIYGPAPSEEQVRELLGLTGESWVWELLRWMVAGDLPAGLRTLQEVAGQGLDPRQFHRLLVERLRALLLVKAGAGVAAELSPEELRGIQALAQAVSLESAAQMLQQVARADFRLDPYSALPLEIALVEALAPEEKGAARAMPSPPRAASVVRDGAPRSRSAVAEEAAPGRSQGVAAEAAAAVAGARGNQGGAVEGAVQVGVGSSPAQRLRAARPAFLLAVKKLDSQAARLMNTRWEPQDGADGSITLVFAHEFHKREIESSREHLRAVEEAIAAVLGERYRVHCALTAQGGGPGEGSSQRPAVSRARVEENPLVRAALELGARVVEVAPGEGTGREEKA